MLNFVTFKENRVEKRVFLKIAKIFRGIEKGCIGNEWANLSTINGFALPHLVTIRYQFSRQRTTVN